MQEARLVSLITDSLYEDLPGVAKWSNYSPRVIRAGIGYGLSEYSRWKPNRRRFATGSLTNPANAGTTTLELVGGAFNVGDVINVDALPGFNLQEQVTVTALEIVDDSVETGFPFLRITIQNPLRYTHKLGAYCILNTSYGWPGLTLVPGQDTYWLPSDWIHPDQESFDVAFGVKTNYGDKPLGFYDSAYAESSMLSGSLYGDRTNYGSGYGMGGWPGGLFPFVAGGPNLIGNPEIVFQFLDEGERKLLIISPAPQTTYVCDFYYYGMHTPASLPYSDTDVLVTICRYGALRALAAKIGADTKQARSGVMEDPTQTVEQLRKLMEHDLKVWEDRTRFVAYVEAG